MLTQLLDHIITTDDLSKLERELMLIREVVYSNPEEYIKRNKSDLRNWVYELINNTNLSPEEVEDEIILFQEKIKNINTLDLVIAFEPSKSFIEKVYDNLQTAFKEKIILNFNYDPTIIGGVIFIYQGKYRDFSMKETFEEELENSRETILESLGNMSN